MRKAWISLRRQPLAIVTLVILLAFACIAILAPFIAKPRLGRSAYEIPRCGFFVTPQPPSIGHPFGTTEGQFDIFYGVVWGTRTAFKIAFVVVGCGFVLGVTIGSVSAFYGGFIDEVLMRITDIFLSFPFLMAAMVLATVLGKGLGSMLIALIVFRWMGYARLIRSEVLHLKEITYVEAARCIGVSNSRVMLHHILPNSFYPVLVQGSMDIGRVITTASALSFLGLGVEPGYADWGQMVSFARNWILGEPGDPFHYWFTVAFPGGALFLFVLSWNILGDFLRDILDPRMRGR